MLYDHHGIATGTRGKEPARHGQLLPEQADQQEGCHRPLRLWLPWHHKGQDDNEEEKDIDNT